MVVVLVVVVVTVVVAGDKSSRRPAISQDLQFARNLAELSAICGGISCRRRIRVERRFLTRFSPPGGEEMAER